MFPWPPETTATVAMAVATAQPTGVADSVTSATTAARARPLATVPPPVCAHAVVSHVKPATGRPRRTWAPLVPTDTQNVERSGKQAFQPRALTMEKSRDAFTGPWSSLGEGLSDAQPAMILDGRHPRVAPLAIQRIQIPHAFEQLAPFHRALKRRRLAIFRASLLLRHGGLRQRVDAPLNRRQQRGCIRER